MIETVDYYEHGDGDVFLCPDCDEIVDGHRFHPGCCAHEEVETDDDGLDLKWHTCLLCGSQVFPEMDESGNATWTTM